MVSRQLQTLAEFSRIYLESLEAAIDLEIAVEKDDDQEHFAARVALSMRRTILSPNDTTDHVIERPILKRDISP